MPGHHCSPSKNILPSIEGASSSPTLSAVHTACDSGMEANASAAATRFRREKAVTAATAEMIAETVNGTTPAIPMVSAPTIDLAVGRLCAAFGRSAGPARLQRGVASIGRVGRADGDSVEPNLQDHVAVGPIQADLDVRVVDDEVEFARGVAPGHGADLPIDLNQCVGLGDGAGHRPVEVDPDRSVDEHLEIGVGV